MMQPGEKVVSAVTYRDFVLVFGDAGSVVKMWLDETSGRMVCEVDVRIASR